MHINNTRIKPIHALILLAFSLVFLVGLIPLHAQGDPSQLPLIHLEDFQYRGAFRLPDDTYGTSNLNYSQGPIAYNPDNHSIFIVGHAHHQQIAEFVVPDLVVSDHIPDLNMAGAPLQIFSDILGRVPGGNPQNLNRVGGIEYVSTADGAELIVNAYEYYDAPGDNTHTTAVVRTAGNLAASAG